MRKLSILLLLALFLTSCTSSKGIDYDEIIKASVHAEKVMRERGITTASSSQANDYVMFRIMAKDRLTNEEAAQLIEEFITLLEQKITDKIQFNKEYSLLFDIKSQKDGTVLFNGKREKGEDELWWQFPSEKPVE